MTALLQPSQSAKSTIATITASMLGEIKRTSDVQKRQLDAEAKRQTKWKRERQQEATRVRRLRAWLLPRARHGLSNLIALNSQPETIEMLELSGSLHRNTGLVFYDALRPSGDAWDIGPEDGSGERSVTITFLPDSIGLCSGSNNPHDTSYNSDVVLKHTASPNKREAFLKKLMGYVSYRTNGRRALDPNQREDEWDPHALLISVLAECTSQKNIQHYLGIALKNFRA